MIFHPLDCPCSELPKRLNNPFSYTPSKLMLSTVAKLVGLLPHYTPHTGMEGKMLGLLIVEKNGKAGYLQAYSGQMADSQLRQMNTDPKEWVPMVLDYLQADGYFMQEDARISSLNKLIAEKESSTQLKEVRHNLSQAEHEALSAIDTKRKAMAEAKALRQQRRSSACITAQEQEAMIRESQYLKAELHREKLKWRELLSERKKEVERMENEIASMKQERRRLSDNLQQWLFSHFRFRCFDGSEASLLDIFSPQIPPSGAGECCEPKLLDYALRHDMRPVEMATFWWGDAPAKEVRRHGSFYPACRGKCRPILTRMLRGADMDEERMESTVGDKLTVVYEDEWLAVVRKPAGMPSVRGKLPVETVEDFFRHRWNIPDDQPIMPHRLDMSTSGLLIAARDAETYKALQRQFALRTVVKTYSALLPRDKAHHLKPHGIIDLPLRPDPDDRPRQVADTEYGKQAISEYTLTHHELTTPEGWQAVEVILQPHTGRTHQLRVHCAHTDGLGIPILGDRLYGESGLRLYLHAQEITFTHPHTHRRITFRDPAPWNE